MAGSTAVAAIDGQCCCRWRQQVRSKRAQNALINTVAGGVLHISVAKIAYVSRKPTAAAQAATYMLPADPAAVACGSLLMPLLVVVAAVPLYKL